MSDLAQPTPSTMTTFATSSSMATFATPAMLSRINKRRERYSIKRSTLANTPRGRRHAAEDNPDEETRRIKQASGHEYNTRYRYQILRYRELQLAYFSSRSPAPSAVDFTSQLSTTVSTSLPPATPQAKRNYQLETSIQNRVTEQLASARNIAIRLEESSIFFGEEIADKLEDTQQPAHSNPESTEPLQTPTTPTVPEFPPQEPEEIVVPSPPVSASETSSTSLNESSETITATPPVANKKKKKKEVHNKSVAEPSKSNAFVVKPNISNMELASILNKAGIKVTIADKGKVAMAGNCAYESVWQVATKGNTVKPTPKDKEHAIMLLRHLAVARLILRLLTEESFCDLLAASTEAEDIYQYLRGQLDTKFGSADKYGSNLELHEIGVAFGFKIVVLVEEGSKETGGVLGDASTDNVICMINTRRQHMRPVFLKPTKLGELKVADIVSKTDEALRMIKETACQVTSSGSQRRLGPKVSLEEILKLVSTIRANVSQRKLFIATRSPPCSQ
eukprot:GEZU01019756.1.p1 GENE.GEZU01019756.1~~GEZU01019756.1.p1  ORF type:complete len:507 (+),score=85.50 GEZU01019756.1:104-1624(+)